MDGLLDRLGEFDLAVTRYFNRVNHRQLSSRFFAIISRLGNGVFWYLIIFSLPVIYGLEALEHSLEMLVVGFIALLIYRMLKSWTSRQRPCHVDNDILQNVPALDLYSFPSGHTMHAVSFSFVLTSYYPEWGWLVWPFTLLVAISRLVLGLHYPSDVVVGALIGAGVAIISVSL